jgi:hypothetical protein
VFCRLRDVETRVNLPRIEKIIKEDTPFVPGIDTDAWYETCDYAAENFGKVIAEYFEARMQVIQALAELPPAAWERQARHAIFGPTRLQELQNISVEHDILHVRQIQKLIQNNR